MDTLRWVGGDGHSEVGQRGWTPLPRGWRLYTLRWEGKDGRSKVEERRWTL
jgi:hypothetical protein